jgi:anti-sigma regulatory factor (Ser/Thr protein kinase)
MRGTLSALFLNSRSLRRAACCPGPAMRRGLRSAAFTHSMRRYAAGASSGSVPQPHRRASSAWAPNRKTIRRGWAQLAAQKAAMGFQRRIAAQFAAALGEMFSNVHEHSGAPSSGIAAFLGGGDGFEFAVVDSGIGVRDSLRSCTDYADLTDDGKALRLALTDGVSRYGAQSGRGKGFRPIFVGLANLSGALRFRSGDHALVVDGQKIGDVTAVSAQKVPIPGFLATVSCLKDSWTSKSVCAQIVG